MEKLYDTNDFIELLLRHLFRSALLMKKALELKLTGDDLIGVGQYEMSIYKYLANIALAVGHAPISPELCAALALEKIPPQLGPSADQLFLFIFKPGINLDEAFFLEHLYPFLKHKRSSKIIQSAGSNLERIIQDHERLILPMNLDDISTPVNEIFVRPMAKMLKKPITAMVSMGYPKLNAALGGGLGYREYLILAGFSGSGKTALSTCIARGAALEGKKVLLVSLEEEHTDISNRVYSATYRTNYSSLHSGSGYMELEAKFFENDAESKRTILAENLVIAGLKQYAPLSVNELKAQIARFVKEGNFYPDLVIVDQMSFIMPNESMPNEAPWQKEKKVSNELDTFSHQEIIEGTGKFFALVVLHQVNGNVKLKFSREDLAGFKAIINPADSVLGLGRENEMSNNFEIFSLKNRHNNNFCLQLLGELEYMTFLEVGSLTTIQAPIFVKEEEQPKQALNRTPPEFLKYLTQPQITTL